MDTDLYQAVGPSAALGHIWVRNRATSLLSHLALCGFFGLGWQRMKKWQSTVPTSPPGAGWGRGLPRHSAARNLTAKCLISSNRRHTGHYSRSGGIPSFLLLSPRSIDPLRTAKKIPNTLWTFSKSSRDPLGAAQTVSNSPWAYFPECLSSQLGISFPGSSGFISIHIQNRAAEVRSLRGR